MKLTVAKEDFFPNDVIIAVSVRNCAVYVDRKKTDDTYTRLTVCSPSNEFTKINVKLSNKLSDEEVMQLNKTVAERNFSEDYALCEISDLNIQAYQSFSGGMTEMRYVATASGFELLD